VTALVPAPTPRAGTSLVPTATVAPLSASSAPTQEASPPAPPTSDAQAGPSLDDATRNRLATILERTTGKGRVAGLQVAVRLADGQTWLGSSGEAQFVPDRPVEDDTVFSVASITKTFIAALILQLAEEGKLDLDVPFGRYWQDAPRKDSVTIRQLLSHTSGIYNYFEHPRYGDISRAWLRPVSADGLASREHAWTYDEIMGLVKTGYCPAGECYHYSNTNYVILGRIAESVGGAPLHEQLRQRFFDPLGMTSTYYQPAEVPPADAAHGHWDYGSGYSDHTRDARVLPFEAALTVADAAGAIASTARDLSMWADALYGGSVLAPASLSQMTTMLEPGLYGLGTDVAVFAGQRAYGHRGGLRGFESSMWHFPATGVTIALLSNQGNWLTDVPMEKLATAIFGRSG
jgi:CubicO group peptidase (beta-lactamase class C family)